MSDKSYEKINFALRPAKCIERKMLCEVFRKLSSFSSLEFYRYIGFGSTYFSDFALFHRALGITDMLSIEKDVGNKDRFMFNRPYKCIEIAFEESNVVLPSLSWTKPTILWLDYDDRLNSKMLTDVKFFCAAAPPASLLLVTVNAQPDNLGENGQRLSSLRSRVGENKIPVDVREKDLSGWGNADVYRRILANEIKETLLHRNGTLPPNGKMKYKQLINFHYADNAKMLTIGGLLYNEEQTNLVEGIDCESLPYVRTGDLHYDIEAPNLTYREIHNLDSQLPTTDSTTIRTAVPQKDRELYSKVYRYYPTFAEMDI